MKRAGLAAVGLVLLAALAALVLLEGGAEDGDDCPAGPCLPATVPGTTADESLALTYGPVLYFREQAGECDRSGSAYRPEPVEIVLGNSEVTLRQAGRAAETLRAPAASDLYRPGPDAFLDFPGNPLRPGCTYERDARRFGEGLSSTAYARIVRVQDPPVLVVQYWFFYYFNDWNNKHEGDWEMIQVVFEASAPAEALAVGPSRLAYSQHGGGELAAWDARKLRREAGRPVVYVATGSHANQFSPHIFIGRAEQGTGLGCDDASGPSRRVEPRVVLLPAAVSGPSDPFAWLAFKGRWGELAGPEFDGPTGPNTKRAWSDPLAWEETLRSSSVRAPSRETVGPSAVTAFCDLVATAGDVLLPVLLRAPLVAGAVLVAGGLGSLYSLTRTRYWPIATRPLRARRRIGQVLLVALHLYVRHARVFLGIGLLFLPVTLVVAAVHWLALRVSPVDPIVPVPTENIGQEVVAMYALAEAQFGLAYAVVVAAATAALAAIEAGRPAGLRAAFAAALRRAVVLAPARLAAVVAVGALAFTIVGIPLALRQAVRWTFLEQAVLIDGRVGLGAFRESSSAVGADPWWAAAATLALGFVGLVAAPALGIVVLVAFTSLPVIYVELLTSLIYIALAPYVAIALSLVYLDLKSRHAAEP